MTGAALVQAGVIALIVAWSTAYALRRLLPVTSRRVGARLIAALDRPGAPRWHGFLARLAPRATTGASCGDGCSSCGGCSTTAARVADAEPVRLVLRPPTRR